MNKNFDSDRSLNIFLKYLSAISVVILMLIIICQLFQLNTSSFQSHGETFRLSLHYNIIFSSCFYTDC